MEIHKEQVAKVEEEQNVEARLTQRSTRRTRSVDRISHRRMEIRLMTIKSTI